MINLANICVLIRTQEEYEKILEEARKQGYKWYGEKGVFVLGDQQLPDILKFYSDKTVVRQACPDHTYKLYEASELLGTKELTAREFIDWMVRFSGCSCNNYRKCVLGNENTKCKKMLCDNGNILGCVFQTQIYRNGWKYTRLEHHRFEDAEGEKVYRITNYAYKEKDSEIKGIGQFNDIGKPCPLTEVKEWAEIAPNISISNIKRPLYAYFKNPVPNRIDRSSSLGVPIWHNATKELRDLDVAWCRKSNEIEDSKHMTFLPQSAIRYAEEHKIKLPRFLQGVEMGVGVSEDNTVHEHVATLLTEQRIKDINSILAMISTKCGYSQGMFQLDEKTGMMTATQVEADDQETIRTIKNIRDALQNTITNLLYAVNVFADLYSDIPPENWEDTELANGEIREGLESQIEFNFGDITYSYKEDKATWMTYVNQHFMPAWLYFTKFEGMEKEEAQKYVNEAQQQNKDSGLFGEE